MQYIPHPVLKDKLCDIYCGHFGDNYFWWAISPEVVMNFIRNMCSEIAYTITATSPETRVISQTYNTKYSMITESTYTTCFGSFGVNSIQFRRVKNVSCYWIMVHLMIFTKLYSAAGQL